MLVSHSKRFIFLKTGKTAGSSLEIYLAPWCVSADDPESLLGHVLRSGILARGHNGPAGIVGPWRFQTREDGKYYSHAHAHEIRDWVGQTIWDGYFKFTSIRNPYDKVVSWFHYKMPDTERKRLAVADFSEARAAFQDWLLARPPLPLDRPFCQVDGEDCLDGWIRYESLSEDLEAMCRRLGIPFHAEKFPVHNVSARKRAHDWREFYDPMSARVVENAYKWEFDRFGYERL